MGDKDRAHQRQCAGGGQNAGDQRILEGVFDQRCGAAAQPFADSHQHQAEQGRKRQANGRAQQALVDRIFDGEDAGKGQGETADPDRPARGEARFKRFPCGLERSIFDRRVDRGGDRLRLFGRGLDGLLRWLWRVDNCETSLHSRVFGRFGRSGILDDLRLAYVFGHRHRLRSEQSLQALQFEPQYGKLGIETRPNAARTGQRRNGKDDGDQAKKFKHGGGRTFQQCATCASDVFHAEDV